MTTTLLKCYRVYVNDHFGQICDYRSFLTKEDCLRWAEYEWPNHVHSVGRHQICACNHSFHSLVDDLELAGVAIRNEDGSVRPGVFGLEA